MSDELDQMIRQAASAHLALAPARVLTSGGVAAEHDHDDLVGRAMRRLDDPAYLAQLAPFDLQALEAMMMSDSDRDPDRSDPSRASSSSRLAAAVDDSGLHDIRALAQNAKQRISRKMPTVSVGDDELWASTTGQLKAIALPEPALVVALPELPATPAAAMAKATAAAIEGRGAVAGPADVGFARPRKRTGLWLGVGGAAAAAAAAVIVMASGSGDKASDRQSMAAQADRLGASEADRGAAMGPGSAAVPAMPTGAGGASRAVTSPAAPAATTPMVAAGAGAAVDSASAMGSGRAEGRVEPKGDKTERGDKPVTTTAAADKPKKEDGKGPGTADKVKAGAGSGSAAAPPPPSGEKSIDDLLGDATGGKGPGGDAPKLEKKGLDGKDIKAGMGPIAGRAQACYDQHGVAGHVKVKATVDPSGKVLKVDATGEFAGTPTGTCVAAAVKAGAKFPAWDGAPMSVSYVYTLNE